MRSEERSPFATPAASKAPVVLVAAAVLVAGFAAYRWSGWWATEQTAVPASSPPTLAKGLNSPRPLPNMLPRPVARTERQTAPAWVRCETNGRATYSDSACVGATQKSDSTTTRAALSTVQTASNTAASTTVYRCMGYSGVVFWSSTHCHPKKALVERMVSVPRGLDFQQQIVVAERSLSREPVVAAAPERSGPSAAETRQRECRYLDERIRNLDAQARQPQSAAMQDWLREKRKQARDRQFALHC